MSSKLVKQTLTAASIVTITVGFGGRLIGFLREAVIASYYGTSATFETFILAFTIPELVSFVLFAAVPTAIIPWLARRDNRADVPGRQLMWRGALMFTAVFAAVSIFIWLLRAPLLHLLAPDLTPENKQLGERLMLILSWYALFRGMEAYFRGWLHSQKHFIVPAISPVLLNLAILAGIFILAGDLDIFALAYGFLAGSILLLVVHLFAALQLVPADHHRETDPQLSRLMTAVGAVVIVELISLLYPTVDRFMASRWLGEGQIAALRYATNLVMIAPGILVVTFSTASFPWLSELGDAAHTGRLHTLYSESLRMILFTIVPVAAGFLFFGDDIIHTAFQRGSFTGQSSALTASAFQFYAAGLLFYSLYVYQMRLYYAIRRFLRLGSILLLMTAVKIIASLFLIGPMEHNGLALASSLAWLCGFVVMTVDLARTFDLPSLTKAFGPAWRIGPSLAGLVLLWLLARQIWPSSESSSFASAAFRLVVLGISGVALYFGLAWLSRSSEANKLLAKLLPRQGDRS